MADISKNMILTKEGLKAMLPGVLETACPPVVESVKITPWEGSYLLFVPERNLIFLIEAQKGRSTKLIQTTLQKISRPAIALYVNNSSNDLTLITKDDIEQRVAFADLNPSLLFAALTNSPTKKNKSDEDTSPSQIDDISLIENLQDLTPDKAPLLAQYVARLTHGLVRGQRTSDMEAWQEVAKAALKILPEASRDPRLSVPTITVIARSIVFLPSQDRGRAVRSLLELALDSSLSIETREQLSNVALAVVTSLNPNELLQIVKTLRPKLATNEKVPPSLAQIISFVQSRP